MNNVTSTDLANFGFRELDMAGDLLKAACKGLPTNFYEDGITVMMNHLSGNVFLTNSDCQVAMLSGGKLEQWYSCPYDGEEGFIEELLENDPEDLHEEDREYIIDVAKADGVDLPENWVKFDNEEDV